VSRHPFPRLRWAGLGWLAIWAPSYAAVYGFVNFLHLCDVAVILTCAGLWRGSALLLSSQALASIVIDLGWDLDLLGRLLTGRHLLGWTAYMWDEQWPLAVRLMSCFHVVWPVLLVWSLRRVGYDRRALSLQCAIALVFLVAARIAAPGANINFAYRDPLLQRSWGPGPVHLAAILAGLVVVVYLPVHLALRAVFPPPARGGAVS
jgi:hypothetical protein